MKTCPACNQTFHTLALSGLCYVCDAPKANETQHGGDHYKNKTIQPWDYIAANDLDFFQGSAIKYITRFREKNGEQDLRKAIHFIKKLIEVEYGKD